MKTITDLILNNELPDLTRDFVIRITKLLNATYYETDGQSVSTIGRLLGDFARHPDIQANKDLRIAIRIATQIVYAETNSTKDAANWRDALPPLEDEEDKKNDFTYGGWLMEVIAGTARTANGSECDLEMMFKYLADTVERTTHPEEYFFRAQYLAELIEDESLPDEMRNQLRAAVGLNETHEGEKLHRAINRILLTSRKPEEPPAVTEDPNAKQKRWANTIAEMLRDGHSLPPDVAFLVANIKRHANDDTQKHHPFYDYLREIEPIEINPTPDLPDEVFEPVDEATQERFTRWATNLNEMVNGYPDPLPEVFRERLRRALLSSLPRNHPFCVAFHKAIDESTRAEEQEIHLEHAEEFIEENPIDAFCKSLVILLETRKLPKHIGEALAELTGRLTPVSDLHVTERAGQVLPDVLREAIGQSSTNRTVRERTKPSIRELIDNARDAVIELLEHPDCPQKLRALISDAICEYYNLNNPGDSDANHIRRWMGELFYY